MFDVRKLQMYRQKVYTSIILCIAMLWQCMIKIRNKKAESERYKFNSK